MPLVAVPTIAAGDIEAVAIDAQVIRVLLQFHFVESTTADDAPVSERNVRRIFLERECEMQCRFVR